MSSETDDQIQADVSGEAIDERTLDILFDLHRDTVEAFRDWHATQHTNKRTDVYRRFVSALTTEIIYLEPALRESDYYQGTRLGTLDHGRDTVVFDGLASVIEYAEGVTLTVNVEARGDTSATVEQEQTIHIPSHVLTTAFRTLQQWYNDVGLTTEFSEQNNEWEI